MNHTPTPFNILYGTQGRRMIAHVVTPIADIRPTTDEADQANAAFIVRACNSYDALVENLEMLLTILESEIAYIKKRGGQTLAEGHVRNARAALKLAKESK